MRLPRFRLRTLMIAVAIIAVVATDATWRLREMEREHLRPKLLRIRLVLHEVRLRTESRVTMHYSARANSGAQGHAGVIPGRRHATPAVPRPNADDRRGGRSVVAIGDPRPHRPPAKPRPCPTTSTAEEARMSARPLSVRGL